MSLLIGPACADYLARTKHRQEDLAELLGVSQSTVNRWINGGEASESTALGVLEKLGWKIDRARPDYDPLKDALAETKRLRDVAIAHRVREAAAPAYGAPPMMVGGSSTAKPKPVRVSADSGHEELWRDVNDLRALMDDTRARTLRPEGSAPRAAIFVEATGEVVLDPTAPTDAARRSITSAAGLEDTLELCCPSSMADTKGPLIVARSDRHQHGKPETIRVLREPKDARPRAGVTGVLQRPDRPGILALRSLRALAGSTQLVAESSNPAHDSFLVDPASTVLVAILVAQLP